MNDGAYGDCKEEIENAMVGFSGSWIPAFAGMTTLVLGLGNRPLRGDAKLGLLREGRGGFAAGGFFYSQARRLCYIGGAFDGRPRGEFGLVGGLGDLVGDWLGELDMPD